METKMVPIKQILYEDLEENGDSERVVEISRRRARAWLGRRADPPPLSTWKLPDSCDRILHGNLAENSNMTATSAADRMNKITIIAPK
jgi:hypothetical protein